jgi:hypothetical protein
VWLIGFVGQVQQNLVDGSSEFGIAYMRACFVKEQMKLVVAIAVQGELVDQSLGILTMVEVMQVVGETGSCLGQTGVRVVRRVSCRSFAHIVIYSFAPRGTICGSITIKKGWPFVKGPPLFICDSIIAQIFCFGKPFESEMLVH